MSPTFWKSTSRTWPVSLSTIFFGGRRTASMRSPSTPESPTAGVSWRRSAERMSVEIFPAKIIFVTLEHAVMGHAAALDLLGDDAELFGELRRPAALPRG